MPAVVSRQIEPRMLQELCSFPVEELGKVDIGRVNLLCALVCLTVGLLITMASERKSA